MGYKMKGFSGFQKSSCGCVGKCKCTSPAKHGSLEDFQKGVNGHNPDTMSADHEDWHLKQSGDSPNKQKRVKKKTPSSKNSEKDLDQWQDNKNMMLRFLKKHTDKDGKITATDDDWMNEVKRQAILERTRKVVKGTQDVKNDKPIT